MPVQISETPSGDSSGQHSELEEKYLLMVIQLYSVADEDTNIF